MQTTCLYIRVSTDEQATKGYSLRNQRETLSKYCAAKGIEVYNVIQEDYSAKNFNRPEWKKLLAELSHIKIGQRPGTILFTRWDRFSRNIADAYYMIGRLKNMGIEVQTTDQPLDMSIPESKIMLAVYIATVEVENERRSINIRQGMRKAKEDGWWTGPAPIGYRNAVDQNGKKCIVLFLPEALIIKFVFKQAAKGNKSITSIYNEALELGLKCSRTNFWALLQNPVYCGKISIHEINKKQRRLIKGQHERLISDEIFAKAQERFNHTNKNLVFKKADNNSLPLRRFLTCPVCSRLLTGSASKGRNAYYYYYHCRDGCKFRTRADLTNNIFLSELEKLVPNAFYISVLKAMLEYADKEVRDEAELTQTEINRNIKRLCERVNKAKGLLITGDIDREDYEAIKSDCEHSINTVGTDLQKATLQLIRANKMRAKAINELTHLSLWFQTADIATRREIIYLLISPKAVFNSKTFSPLFNNKTRFVFDLVLFQEMKNANPVSKKSLDPVELEQSVITYEHERDNTISPIEARELIGFLERLSQLLLGAN
jgi:site-specific DNA recombinase